MTDLGDCNTCDFWRSRINRKMGVLIPGGYGKCTRPDGHCMPHSVRSGIPEKGNDSTDRENEMAKQSDPPMKSSEVLEPEVVYGSDDDITPLNETFPGEEPMSVREKKRLEELEEIVTRNFKAFYEVGCALREIRNTRLYRETHQNFSDYASDLWDMQYAHAKRMVKAADVVDGLLSYTHQNANGSHGSQNDIPIPQNERQARALAKYPKEKQIEIWKEAVQTADGKITAAHVTQTAKRLHGAKVEKKIRKARKEPQGVKMSQRFEAAFKDLLEAINEERLADWKNTDREVVLRHLEGLVQAVAEPL